MYAGQLKKKMNKEKRGIFEALEFVAWLSEKH